MRPNSYHMWQRNGSFPSAKYKKREKNQFLDIYFYKKVWSTILCTYIFTFGVIALRAYWKISLDIWGSETEKRAASRGRGQRTETTVQDKWIQPNAQPSAVFVKFTMSALVPRRHPATTKSFGSLVDDVIWSERAFSHRRPMSLLKPRKWRNQNCCHRYRRVPVLLTLPGRPCTTCPSCWPCRWGGPRQGPRAARRFCQGLEQKNW